MDVGSLLGALTGGHNQVQLEIRLNPPATAVPLDHTPSWRLHRNPFWRVKHPLMKEGGAMVQGGGGYAGPHHTTTAVSSSYGSTPPSSSSSTYRYPYGNTSEPELIQEPFAQQQQQQQQRLLTASSHEVTYAYDAQTDIEGLVIIRFPGAAAAMNHNNNMTMMMNQPSKKLMEHLGIKVQFLGRIDMSVGVHEGRPHYDFISLSKELSPPGMIFQPETVLPFKFKNAMDDKELESYQGRNVAVRYLVKVVLERKFLPPLTQEKDVWIQLLGTEPEAHQAIKMEVGIEDCLHIEFEYERRIYHLQDVITGQIHFLLVSIKIKHMELAVIRRETSGEGVALAAAAAEGSTAVSATVDPNNMVTETQTLVKYEIMDGAPVKGEVIPVQLSLAGIPADLTPTYTASNNRFSVRYFLNLVLVDEDDRRYFKQQEIILWRKYLG